MPAPIAIAVHGASGRMGRAVLHLARATDDLAIVAALVRSGCPYVGKPVLPEGTRPLLFSTDLPEADTLSVLIDFSVAAAFDDALALAVASNAAFISGTTGLESRQMAALDRAAADIPVLWSANFSLGVAVLSRLVRDAARSLPDWECEIFDVHHRHKRDAPSGTAIALGREVALARGLEFEQVARRSRDADDRPGTGDEIGFASLRAGDVVGEHTVLFAATGERIELTHRATDRDIFARGAITAARWISARSAGRYSLADVVEN